MLSKSTAGGGARGAPGGEFAHGHDQGQCGDGEYAAGVAHSGAWARGHKPAALLCRPL